MSTVRRLSPLPLPTERAELVRLRDTAARVVRARHAGDETEDLIQEAWARIAFALRERAVEDPHAYAAGIAANLVRWHDRKDRCRQRRTARLWIRPTIDAPDGDIVRDEEAAALATALRRLPPETRDVLVAHVVHGMDTGTLAAQAGTTPGAVAACLARSRAMLRVEYVIAFRRLPEPADRCRRICYAVSANDSRRELRLDAAGHIPGCDTCQSITDALRERRRPAMGAPILVRLSSWVARLTSVDSAGARVGVAGGLVGMGVVGALALGGAPAPTTPGAAGTAAASPAATGTGSSPRRAGRVLVNARTAGVAAPRGRRGSPAGPPDTTLGAVADTAGGALPAVPAPPTGVTWAGPVSVSASLPSGSFGAAAATPQVSDAQTGGGGVAVWVAGAGAQIGLSGTP